MKKTSLYIIVALLGMLLFNSCVDDDYAAPTIVEPTFEMPAGASLISIEDLKAIYNEEYPADRTYTLPVDRSNKYQNAEQFMTVEDDIYISGYVISDDKEGNFYKALVIQPDLTGSSEGISISIGESSLYTKFAKGQKIFVKCKGLTLGKYGNEIQLGGAFSFYKFRSAYRDRPAMKEYRLSPIASPSIDFHIFNDASPASIIPNVKTIAEVLANENYKFTYLELHNVQFDTPGVTWGKQGEDHNDAFPFNTDVNIVDQNGDKLPLFTSNFSKFSHELITDKSGSIKGVLSYHSGNPQFVVNSLEDVNMTEPRLSSSNDGDVTYDFNIDFDTHEPMTDFSMIDWLNYKEKGSRTWFVKEYKGNTYAECSNFGTSNSEMVSWLITPQVIVDEDKFLIFETAIHHWEHDESDKPLELFYSEDFDGTNVKAATWVEMTIPALPTSSTKWYEFISSGKIALPTGKNIYLALKYSGTDVKTTGVQIDNVRVFKNN